MPILTETAPDTTKSSSAAKASPIPAGFHSITPHLICAGAEKAIAFYQAAFGATLLDRFTTPDGRLLHAALRIGDSVVMLVDEFPEMGGKGPLTLQGSPVIIHLFVDNADAVYAQAVRAGAAPRMPLQDMFWGDRYGQVIDPFGHTWSIATHLRDLTPTQIAENMTQAGCGAGA